MWYNALMSRIPVVEVPRKRFRTLVVGLGKTHGALAKELGVSTNTLNAWLYNERVPLYQWQRILAMPPLHLPDPYREPMEDPKKLIKALQPKSKDEKKGSMFYLPKGLDRDFRRVCGTGNASKVLECLIRNFLEDVEKSKK